MNWRAAIPDFNMTVNSFHLVPDSHDITREQSTVKFSIRTTNKGTFVNDLPIKKASGHEFIFRGVVDFTVKQDGFIAGIEEWYTWDFGEGRDVANYHTLEIAMSEE